MTPPPVRTAENGKVRVQLRGFERVYTAVDESSTKVAHVMVVKGPVRILVQHLPTALMHTFNLHPRMRALQVKGAFHEAEIQPQITVDDVATRRLLRFRSTDEAELQTGVWERHAQEECERFVNRYEEFASFLKVWTHESNDMARLFLFSDHYMCDGTSGMTILNDTLKHVALLASQTNIEPKQHPVRASPYNLWLDNFTLTTPLTKMTVKLLAPVIKSILKSHTKPLLPPRSDQADLVYPFKNNPSYAQFAQDIKNGLKSPAVAFTNIFMDQNFNSASVSTAFSRHVIKNSCSGDVNISNIGRYPYPTKHKLGDAGEFSVENLFLYESVPFFSMGTLMYVSTVKSFNYSMLHKYEDEDAKWLFQVYVAFCEHIGEVDQNSTMADVLAQVEPLLA
ncbi:hypothetical protein PI124_g4547 [Phytophthora idaei]|nr:hypothetical protein PI124_g4547 [Phytophthora idaei]